MIDDTGISAIMLAKAIDLTKWRQRPNSPKGWQKNSAIIIVFPLISALRQPISSLKVCNPYGMVTPQFGHKPSMHVGDAS
jgi:hypothetical protein